MDWIQEDSDKAQLQGWDIFLCYGSECGDYQLQRIDEPEDDEEPVFEEDTKAWEFVYQQFLVGDKLAVKAFYYLSEKCMEEFQRIKKHCESTLTGGLYNPV